MILEQGPSHTKDVSQAKADLDKFGYCIIPEVLSDDEIEISRQRLLEQAEAEEEQPPEPTQKVQTDVANMMKFAPKIDNVKEYNELVTLLMKHDFGNDSQKVAVLRKLRDMVTQLIK